MKNVTAALDLLAGLAQERGLDKYAEQIDVVSNTLSVLSAVEEEKELRIPLSELPPEVQSSKSVDIIQGFLIELPECDVRIRQAGGDYTMTAKYRPLNQEAEMEISQEMFETLWPSTLKKQSKTRYFYKGWEVDVMDTGGIVAEFEYSKEKTVELPTSWQIKK